MLKTGRSTVLFRVAVTFTVVALAGCAPERATHTPDGRVLVRYWEKWPGFEGEAMQAVVDDFNQSQDRIHVEMLTVSEIDQKLMLATMGGHPPSVAGLWSHNVNVYAERGALTPLDSFLAEAGITRDHYTPVFWDLCAHRGFMWALPSTPASLALHWNKRLFREAGLDPEQPPRSIAELEAMNEQLTLVEIVRDGKPVELPYSDLTEDEREGRTFRVLRMGHLPTEPGWWTPMWGFWFGANLSDGDRTITAGHSGNLAAFEWYQGYPRKFGLHNLRRFGAALGTFASPQNAFLSEEVAMVLQGVWMYNFIDRYAPHLEWGVAPFPSSDPQANPNVTIVECDVLVIPHGAPHPREAFEFIHYVNQREPMEKLVIGQRKFSPLAQTSPDFIARHPNPHIDVFMDLARSPQARYEPRLSVWNEYRDEMVVAAERIFSLRVPPEAALAHVDQRIQRRLDRVMRRWDLIREQRLQEWNHYDPR